MFFHKKAPHQPGCLSFHIVSAVLMFLATIAAFTGVILAHYDVRDGSLIFGTGTASLSLIAFAVCLSYFMKSCKGCMSSCEACTMPPSKKK